MQKCNKNLNIAYKYTQKSPKQEDIVEILKGDDELLKPLAVLSVKHLDEELAKLLLAHLTGVDGKIREAVSFKIAELWGEYSKFLYAPALYTDALCDVNPNVCRNILEILKYMPQIQEPIKARIERILDEIDTICAKFKKNKERSHPLNVKLFNLYWCLEGLYHTLNGVIDQRTNAILLRCATFYDYTIREKAAKIASSAKGASGELLSKLENDVNFYVKAYFCDSINAKKIEPLEGK